MLTPDALTSPHTLTGAAPPREPDVTEAAIVIGGATLTSLAVDDISVGMSTVSADSSNW